MLKRNNGSVVNEGEIILINKEAIFLADERLLKQGAFYVDQLLPNPGSECYPDFTRRGASEIKLVKFKFFLSRSYMYFVSEKNMDVFVNLQTELRELLILCQALPFVFEGNF